MAHIGVFIGKNCSLRAGKQNYRECVSKYMTISGLIKGVRLLKKLHILEFRM
jgi:hypothetical protein